MFNFRRRIASLKGPVAVSLLALLFIAAIGGKKPAPDPVAEPGATEFDLLKRELNIEAPVRIKEFPHALLRDVAGNPFELKRHSGKIVVLSFWASWCPACNQELPLLQSLYDALGPEGLIFVGANFQEDAGTVKSYMRQRGYSFPVAMDATGEAFDHLQAAFLPTTFILTEKGRILGKIVGHREWHSKRIRAAFEQALRNPA